MVELPLMQTLRLQRQLHHEATAGPEVQTSTTGNSLPPGPGGGQDTEAAAAGQQAEGGGGGGASKWYPLRRRAGMQVWGGEARRSGHGEDQKWWEDE